VFLFEISELCSDNSQLWPSRSRCLNDEVDPRQVRQVVVGRDGRAARLCRLAQVADEAGVEALPNGDAVSAQGLGLLIGDVVAVDRSGASRWAEEDLRDDVSSSVFLHVIQVVKNRVELAVRRRIFREECADDCAALRGHLSSHGLIDFLQGRSPEGRSTHAEAVEKLSRAIQLDPARAADKARLEQINAGPTQLKE
jgi:hypothetical protein